MMAPKRFDAVAHAKLFLGEFLVQPKLLIINIIVLYSW